MESAFRPDCENENIPGVWSNLAIGDSRSGSTLSTLGTVTVCGNGEGIKSNRDSYQYAYQTLSAPDLTLTAKITQFTASSKPRNQFGVIIRNSTDPKSALVYVYIDQTGQISFLSRSSYGQNAIRITGPRTSVVGTWLKLVKSNNTYAGYYSNNSSDGNNGTWNHIHTIYEFTQITGSSYTYGLGVSSRDDDDEQVNYHEFATATFSLLASTNIQITPMPSPTPQPTRTPTPTPTFGPSPTPTKTPTPTPTNTPKPTNTPTPTRLPTPTPTYFISD